MNSIKIFVIHYKKLVERKEFMIRQFEKLGITNYEFIEQYDRTALPSEELGIFTSEFPKYLLECLQGNPKPATAIAAKNTLENQQTEEDKQALVNWLCGQQAITLSHIYAYKEISEKYEEALILEDDAVLADDFCERFLTYKLQLPENYSMFYIGNGCNLHIPGHLIHSDCNVYEKQSTRCTDSYLVSKNAALKITEHCKTLQNNVIWPVDWWLNDVMRHLNLLVFWAEPTIVTQGTQNGMFSTSH